DPETLRTGAVSFLRDLESIPDRRPNVKRVFMISGDQHCFSETVPILRNERDDLRGVVYVTLGTAGGWIHRGFGFPDLSLVPPGTLVHAFQDLWGSVRFEVGTDQVSMFVQEAYTDSLIYENSWPLLDPATNGSVDATVATSTGASLRAWPNPSGRGPVQVEFRPAAPHALEPVTDLAIYDVAGRLVRRLIVTEWSAGAHRCVWDGTDEEGHPAAAGTYLARARQASGAGATTRVVLTP
ncbi:MAG: hypothetical protein KC591_09485, partial [Gemmatimonadetes bacterium]|nr:hypothetical protein [Gemmatimonadota bacterium]